MTLRGLFIIPSDYAALQAKGVAHLMKGQEEQIFFERLISVHPWASRTQVVDLSPVHRLYEFHEVIPGWMQRIIFLRYAWHILHQLRLLRKLVQIIDRERLQLIRATDPFFTGVLAWLTTCFLALPYCISIHADYDKRFELAGPREAASLFGSRRVARWVENFVLRRAALVMPIRQSLADKVGRIGVPISKIRVIPHGIDLAPFRSPSHIDIRSDLRIEPGTRILSFAGRLARDNYIDDYLILADTLRQQRSDFVLIMAGDGAERAALSRQITERGLSGIVRLIGFRPQPYIVSLRCQSDVCVCLMGGYSLIEACASGAPVVAYDVEWHNELLESGKSGQLVPEHDMKALVRCVNELLANPEEARRIGDAGRQRAFEYHDFAKTVLVKKECYEQLLQH
jgi:glycosyltransferase involved in cell wall biosynthesis